VTPLQEEPQAGPSGRIAQEGIAIMGDDSSAQVTASEDTAVGKHVEVEDSVIDDPDPAYA
jgi:hypothetical protein